MATEFDAAAHGKALTDLVAETAAEMRPLVPTVPRAPIFHALPDGSVVDRNEQKVRGPVEPLKFKGK